MSSSLLSPNPAVNSDRSATRRRKKKIQREEETLQQNSPIQWKSEAQQQIYSSKLLQALRQPRESGGSSAQKSAPKRVREAADRVLAVTAKGRSRWSRAILTNRLKLKFMKKHSIAKRQQSVMTGIASSAYCRSMKKSKFKILRLKAKSVPSFQRKARVLSHLVPGCRRQPLPVVLEEATDYIAALEMQVRAMTALAELLSVSGGSSSSGGGLSQNSH